ncbi:MAG: YdcF family protein [Bacteroidales bacterium]|nr:YdcF family protein [Bacteroidales bacterium]
MFHPLSWVFILLIFAFFIKKQKVKKKLLYSAVIVLYIFSNSSLFHLINAAWSMPAIELSDNQNYKYAIVPDGMANFDNQVKRIRFSASADRLFQAIYLYKTQKIEKLIISGGSGDILHPDLLESEIIKDYLIKIGIPQKDILIENKSKNTHENAFYTAELLRNIHFTDTCVLITSAMHMPRAKACFKKEGVKILSYPSTQILEKNFYSPANLLLPQADVLSNWQQLFHEIAGYIVYWLRDYI